VIATGIEGEADFRSLICQQYECFFLTDNLAERQAFMAHLFGRLGIFNYYSFEGLKYRGMFSLLCHVLF